MPLDGEQRQGGQRFPGTKGLRAGTGCQAIGQQEPADRPRFRPESRIVGADSQGPGLPFDLAVGPTGHGRHSSNSAAGAIQLDDGSGEDGARPGAGTNHGLPSLTSRARTAELTEVGEEIPNVLIGQGRIREHGGPRMPLPNGFEPLLFRKQSELVRRA